MHCCREDGAQLSEGNQEIRSLVKGKRKGHQRPRSNELLKWLRSSQKQSFRIIETECRVGGVVRAPSLMEMGSGSNRLQTEMIKDSSWPCCQTCCMTHLSTQAPVSPSWEVIRADICCASITSPVLCSNRLACMGMNRQVVLNLNFYVRKPFHKTEHHKVLRSVARTEGACSLYKLKRSYFPMR